MQFRGAAIDSRQIQPGMLFVALPGAHVDGHDFIPDALARGAAAVLAARSVPVEQARHADGTAVPVLVASDVVAALQGLASLARAQAAETTFIAVTGSNGKTTVKEMLVAALASVGFVHATPGNYNNHLGVPLTLLNMPEQPAVAVIEIGTSGPGEIAALAALARPDIAAITGIGPAHLEGLGDCFGVAREKLRFFPRRQTGRGYSCAWACCKNLPQTWGSSLKRSSLSGKRRRPSENSPSSVASAVQWLAKCITTALIFIHLLANSVCGCLASII